MKDTKNDGIYHHFCNGIKKTIERDQMKNETAKTHREGTRRDGEIELLVILWL